jgi:hypothetical protein
MINRLIKEQFNLNFRIKFKVHEIRFDYFIYYYYFALLLIFWDL